MLAERRKTVGRDSAAYAFPSVEWNVLPSVKRIVQGSDAITALTMSYMVAELKDKRLALIGSKPWLSTRYGVVSLKGHPMSSAAARFRDFVVDAEAVMALEEEKALAWWVSATSHAPPTPEARRIRVEVPPR